MTTTAADDLRTNLIGAWTLQSYESSSIDGSTVSYPLGAHAQGIIMYTPDGYMSAQLMRSDRLHFSGDDMHPDRLDELAAPPAVISATRTPTASTATASSPTTSRSACCPTGSVERNTVLPAYTGPCRSSARQSRS